MLRVNKTIIKNLFVSVLMVSSFLAMQSCAKADELGESQQLLIKPSKVSESKTVEPEKLGGGFVTGMSPEETCLFFKANYKNRNRHNQLCHRIGRSDFTNMTIVNKHIGSAKNRIQDITTIAFFFDEDEELKRVMSVLDASYAAEAKRGFRHQMERISR